MLKDPRSKKNIEFTITGIGIIILIYMAANNAAKPKNAKIAADAKPDAALELSAIASSEALPEDNAKWGRDPFLQDASKAKERGMEDLILDGIASDRQNPYAVINNEVVKLGDKVNGMTVIEINDNSVVLDENGQRHTLELNTY